MFSTNKYKYFIVSGTIHMQSFFVKIVTKPMVVGPGYRSPHFVLFQKEMSLDKSREK
jgi:hypothetical protein